MVAQSFKWFVDVGTSTEGLSVFKVTCGGNQAKVRLLPFFSAYKYYRLGSVKVTFVPAATLPVDPTGMSYEAGENTVDPRDQFNPGLVRITNGEDMLNDVSDFNSDGANGMYYAMMLDDRWYKFQLQTGMTRTAKPLFWDVGQLHQDAFPGSVVNTIIDNDGSDYGSVATARFQTTSNSGSYVTGVDFQQVGSSPRGLFQTGMKEPMGWLPTDTLYTENPVVGPYPFMAPVPEVELMKIVLPRAYKTRFYYRIYVTETVYFKDPVAIYPNWAESSSGQETGGEMQIDRFIQPMMQAVMPNVELTPPFGATGYRMNNVNQGQDGD